VARNTKAASAAGAATAAVNPTPAAGADDDPWRWPPSRVAAQPVPSLRRRLACWLYEGVLLFGVLTIAALAWGLVTQQRHALEGRTGLLVFLFAVLALYFGWFWTRAGQTLAMQTWHMRLVTNDGRPLGWPRAMARYLLSYIWFLPALAAVHFAGLKGGWEAFGAVLAGVSAYVLIARLHPTRQYWHDVVCGTRLVSWHPPPRKKKKD
jgi:uncharacterized RDD family membrane protein YckC